MRGGNTNLELWQHCFRMGMSTVCRLCPSPNSWRECYPCRKRGSGGYAGSTNPRAGCGPEARAPSASGCWSVLGPPPTACHQSSCRMRAGGPRSQRQRVLVGARPTTDGLPPILGQDAGRRPALPDSGGNSMPDRENDALIDRQANAIRIALQRIVLLRETGPKSAAWQRARIKTMWRLRQQLLADTTPRQVDEHDR
jgi:hypothetical protein